MEEGRFGEGGRTVFFAEIVRGGLGGGIGDRGGGFDELVICGDVVDGGDDPFARCGYVERDTDGRYPDMGGGGGVVLDTKVLCRRRGIRWGDVNGDGLDDFICIGLEGNMYVAINTGGRPPTFRGLANGGLVRRGETWVTQDRVRLGDIDGDGRVDYCGIDLKGDIYCWRNGGQGDAPTEEEGGYWQGMVGGGKPTFYANNETRSDRVDGVHLVDVNGDSRADWVYVYGNGSSKVIVNQRGADEEDGKGLRPHWVLAENGHPSLSGGAEIVGSVFGRWKGSGRPDRIVLNRESGTGLRLDAYENTGSGGTMVKGDGVFYCDMFGRGYDGESV